MLPAFALTLAMLNPTLTMEDYLGRAISRGVPLYNDGQAAACAAVYATALEAIASADGWLKEPSQRKSLAYQLDLATALPDPRDRAWAYRDLIDTLLAGQALPPPPEASERTLFDFSTAADVDRWQVVLDGVMGGRSTGQVSFEEDVLVFTGDTSLANNGGFSSLRAAVPVGSAAGYDALRIRVRGDGRTWILGASAGAGNRGDSYWQRFDTDGSSWQTITVPIREMTRVFFGRPLDGKLQPAALRGVEFYIYDKKAGPFRLEVDTISAVRLPAG